MAGTEHDAHEDGSMDSPSSSSSASAHLDSAQGQSASGPLYDPAQDTGDASGEGSVAEDSIRGAFPPEEGSDSPDDSSGPAWAAESGGVLSGVKSFFLDRPEEREAKKQAKAAGLTTAPAKSGKGKKQKKARGATAVAGPTKVSRRARLLGGKRGRATALMAAILAFALLTAINTFLIVGLFNRPSAEEAASAALREQGRDFPSGQSVAWAEQAVVDWATWDEDDQEDREIRMAQYLTSGMEPQAGWNGRGKQEVTFTSVDPEPEVIDQNHAVVDVAYRLSDNSRRCVSVPVYAYKPEGLTEEEGNKSQWAFGMSGNPIPRPCAPRTGATDDGAASPANDDDTTLREDDELARELTSNFFPDFFAAWAASDANSLRQYTASGVTTIGLGGAMSSTPPPSVSEAVIMTPRDTAPKENTVYYATVPVTWTLAGSSAQVTSTYTVPMKKSGDRWYVAGEPRPSPESADAASGSPAAKVEPEEDEDETPSGDSSEEDSTETSPNPSPSAGADNEDSE